MGGLSDKFRATRAEPSIAHSAGLFPDTIWDHPQNSDLKTLRQDMNVLFPGDSVYVPDKQQRVETAATDKKHKFRRRGVPTRLRLQLFNVETPRADEAYELTIDGAAHQGTTDAKGVIELWVPPGAQRAPPPRANRRAARAATARSDRAGAVLGPERRA